MGPKEMQQKIVEAIQLVEEVANELEDRGLRDITHSADIVYNELEALDSEITHHFNLDD